MKSHVKRLGALLLSGLLFTLAGCSSGNESTKQTAKGRYVEGDYSLPSELTNVYALQRLSDSSIVLVGDSDNTSLEVYSSKDGGKTFNKEDIKTSILPVGNKISSAAVDSQGDIVVAYGMPRKAEGGGMLSSFQGNISYLKIDSKGKSTSISILLPQEKSSDGWTNSLTDLKIAANGDIFGMDNNHIIYQVDSSNGKIRNTYSASGTSQYGIVKNTLLLVTGKSVEQYDITSGSKLQDADILKDYLAGSSKALLIAGSKDNELYFCTDNGLYRYVLGGNVVEQMVDGSLVSLDSVDMSFTNFIVKDDGNFLVSFKSNDSKSLLKNYAFSKDTPAAPGNEITVYSLADNTTIRQEITKFQAANPDIHVVFEVGRTGKDAVSPSDAIKTLNTEIMAGKGPDVLILDGMPVNSYAQKGLLADISDVLKEYEGRDELFKNIVEAYQNNGKIYAAPLRFKIPIINAHTQVLNQITDLKSMADFAESYRQSNPSSGNIAFAKDSKMLLEVLFPVVSGNWFKSNGTFDDAKLTDSIADLKRINDAVMKIRTKDETQMYEKKSQMAKNQGMVDYDDNYGNAFEEYDVEQGTLQINMGKISTFSDIAQLSSLSKKDSTISYKLLNENQHYFSPAEMVGMNSKTKNKQNAKKFISYLFSEDAQAIDYTGGYPVNKKSFKAAQAMPSQKTMDDLNLGRPANNRITWPTQKQFEDFTSMVETLNTPTFEDKVIFDAVCDEFDKCATGNQSVEETVKNIENKLNIYLSE